MEIPNSPLDPMIEKPSILIVEDDPIIAEDLSDLVHLAGYKVVGIAYDSDTALDYLANRKPHFALLDVNIKGTQDGIDIAQIIQKKYKIPFIFITSYADRHTLERAKVTMPYGYIVKPFDQKDIVTSLEIALYRHQQHTKHPVPEKAEIDLQLVKSLTDKEYEILKDLFDGLTNLELAEKNFVSKNTIKSHIKNLYSKLNVHDRVELIKFIDHF